jgi:hypothetical protein
MQSRTGDDHPMAEWDLWDGKLSKKEFPPYSAHPADRIRELEREKMSLQRIVCYLLQKNEDLRRQICDLLESKIPL